MDRKIDKLTKQIAQKVNELSKLVTKMQKKNTSIRGGQSIPTKFHLIVAKNYKNHPPCPAAIEYLKHHNQHVILYHADSKIDMKKVSDLNLIIPKKQLKARQFPYIFSPIGEYIGSTYHLKKYVHFGNVYWSFSPQVSKQEKEFIDFILPIFGNIYFPFCTFDKRNKTGKHLIFSFRFADSMISSMLNNKHVRADRRELQAYRDFSVTFMVPENPRYIYLNKSNIYNTNGVTSHFKNNEISYLLYVILHEVGHALAHPFHIDEQDYLKKASCKLMSQQTNYKFDKLCELLRVQKLLKYIQPERRNYVQNKLAAIQKIVIHKQHQIKAGSKMDSQFDSYFESASSLNSIVEDSDFDTPSYQSADEFTQEQSQVESDAESELTGGFDGESYVSDNVSEHMSDSEISQRVHSEIISRANTPSQLSGGYRDDQSDLFSGSSWEDETGIVTDMFIRQHAN